MVVEIIQKDTDLNMQNDITGSMQEQCNQRLTNLYNEYNAVFVICNRTNEPIDICIYNYYINIQGTE